MTKKEYEYEKQIQQLKKKIKAYIEVTDELTSCLLKSESENAKLRSSICNIDSVKSVIPTDESIDTINKLNNEVVSLRHRLNILNDVLKYEREINAVLKEHHAKVCSRSNPIDAITTQMFEKAVRICTKTERVELYQMLEVIKALCIKGDQFSLNDASELQAAWEKSKKEF